MRVGRVSTPRQARAIPARGWTSAYDPTDKSVTAAEGQCFAVNPPQDAVLADVLAQLPGVTGYRVGHSLLIRADAGGGT